MSKTMRTGIIRYNITNRNRKYVGQPRNFNVAKVVQLINSNTVQELVEKGDLFGYLGHDVRQTYGMTPSETGVATNADGKLQMLPIEPCIRTISIKAYDDGTIEHEAEFIDNHLGRTAWEWFKNKMGGFSSVFWPTPENPTAFFGFDYVRMPNFDSNRGYMVADSAMYDIADEQKQLSLKQRAALRQAKLEETAAIMDSIAHNYINMQQQVAVEKNTNQELLRKLNCLQAAYDSAQQDIAALKSDVDSLEYENSRLNIPQKHQPMMQLGISNTGQPDAVMDSTQQPAQPQHQPMMRVNINQPSHNSAVMDSVELKKTNNKPISFNTNNELNQPAAVMDSLRIAAETYRKEIESHTQTKATAKNLISALDKAMWG